MTPFEILALLLTVAASFAYVNHRWIRLPPTIGLMALSLGASTALILVDRFGWIPVQATAARILDRIAFGDTLLHGMLGALLFAGSLHIDLRSLREEKVPVFLLALGSTLLSTLLIGAFSFAVARALSVPLSFGYCLLFGALIAPTDPISVLGILKEARVPKRLEVQIAGESLFNDGIGVVVFLAVLGAVTKGGSTTGGQLLIAFFREAAGGAAFGLLAGYAAYRIVMSIDHYQTELLVTLALVLGGYALAEHIHISAPIAAVCAGLIMGNPGRQLGMSDVTRDHLDKFWSLIDEILNAILFVLMGFELIRLTLSRHAVMAGVLMIPVVLVARLLSVAAPIALTRRWIRYERGTTMILTWGGLRGGISVALALSIPVGGEHDLVVSMTYAVVVFAVLVQGLTLGRLVKRLGAGAIEAGIER